MRSTNLLILFFIISASIIYGGEGEGSSIPYTGSKVQATINNTNAEQITAKAYQGAGSGIVFGVLTQSLEKCFIKKAENEDDIDSGAIKTSSGTEFGNCGGIFSYTINYDVQTGNIVNGTANFNNYCAKGFTISGVIVSISGEINLKTGNIERINISFVPLIGIYKGDSFIISGGFNSTISNTKVTVGVGILMNDNKTGKVYRSGYTITMTSAVTYIDVKISGNFYHPDYGYVGIYTTRPFNYSNDWLSQGVLIVRGRKGSAGGNTGARLTALSSLQYMVDADTDGDGEYDDFSSGVRNW